MTYLAGFLGMMGLWLVFSGAAPALGLVPPGYRIATNDILKIDVTDHPELSVTVSVIEDGTVTLPLVGSVAVKGLSVTQVKEKLEEIYNERFLANPSIAINLVQTKVKQFFISGEVKSPGAYPLIDGVTVLKAVVTAGGFTDYAGKSRVKVLRNGAGKRQMFKVNIRKVEKGHLDNDVELQSGDIVIVPKAWI